MILNLATEDMARWPDETRVLFDIALEQAWRVEVYAKDDADAALHLKTSQVAPYEMVDRDGAPSPFGLTPGYPAWAGNSAAETSGVFTQRVFDAWEYIERNRRHSDCPLAYCEEFDGQRLFPAASTRTARPTMYDIVRDAHLMIGEPLRAESIRVAENFWMGPGREGPQTALQVAAYILVWMADPRADAYRENAAVERAAFHRALANQVRDIARGLVAAMNAPPRVLHFINGSSITLPANPEPGDTVTINGTTFSATDLVADPRPAFAAGNPGAVVDHARHLATHRAMLRGAEAAALTAKQHLERARPKRRLDGRRT